MRLFSTLLILFGFSHLGFAQNTSELFTSKELKSAMAKGTRTTSGIPGPNYWQNQSNYRIEAELLPNERKIIGKERIEYINNSPDSLSVLYVHLIQNLLKKGGVREWDLGTTDLHDGVQISFVSIDGQSIDLQSSAVRHYATLMYLQPPKIFLPSSTHEIIINWELTLSGTRNVRMGTYNKTNFMVAYWYPKIAVYDDISGWATEPHKGSCEYYHEFGNYEVSLTLPKDYVAWSTGELQNTEAIFTKPILDKINEAKQSDKVISILDEQNRAKKDYLQKGEKHLWKFTATAMPDFAFAASDSYLWDATSIASNGRRISIHTAYKANTSDFRQVADLARNIIDFFDNQSPAIPFPYAQISLFNGKGGMEFPGMVNDGDANDFNSTLYVTAHEMGHSYFPFNTGLNEQKYAWMDEGLITFLPRKIVAKYTKDESYVLFADLVAAYNKSGGTELEVPLMISSTNAISSYRYHAYTRSSAAFYTLSQYLGEATFDACLQEFSRQWEHKHPNPYDFFYTFNKVAGQDLGWFWKPWFFDLGYADLALGKIENGKIEILNIGGFPVPINLTIVVDGKEIVITQKADVWKNNVRQIWIDLPPGKISKLLLDSELTPDVEKSNNLIEL